MVTMWKVLSKDQQLLQMMEGNDGNDDDDVGGSVYGWFNACNLKMDSFELSLQFWTVMIIS